MSTLTDTTAVGPVQGSARIAYLDVLRGFAVMAIFIVNIKGMAMPFPWYMNPAAWASETDQLIATIQKYLVDDKWRTNFSALYGAGLAMIWDRLQARGDDSRSILWRRNLWLLLFGSIHLFLMWIGDILFAYAVSGMLAVFFVRMSIKKQLFWGSGLMIFAALWMSGFMLIGTVDEKFATEMSGAMWNPDSPDSAKYIAAYGGSIMDQLAMRIPEAAMMGIMGLIVFGMLPITLGLMVVGMALYRSGFFQGIWSAKLTFILAVIFLGAAWALDYIQVSQISASDYSFDTYLRMTPLSILDGWLGAFGYAALISTLLNMGLKMTRVAAVGRMAFTNYITCTLIGTTLAGGHGAGWYGDVTLVQLMWVVLATFLAMLVWSPLWLKFFRFGPLEWLWRSLLYGKAQPFRR